MQVLIWIHSWYSLDPDPFIVLPGLNLFLVLLNTYPFSVLLVWIHSWYFWIGSILGTPESGSIPGTPGSGSIYGTPGSGSIHGTPGSGSILGTPVSGSILGTPVSGSIHWTPWPILGTLEPVSTFGTPGSETISVLLVCVYSWYFWSVSILGTPGSGSILGTPGSGSILSTYGPDSTLVLLNPYPLSDCNQDRLVVNAAMFPFVK